MKSEIVKPQVTDEIKNYRRWIASQGGKGGSRASKVRAARVRWDKVKRTAKK